MMQTSPIQSLSTRSTPFPSPLLARMVSHLAGAVPAVHVAGHADQGRVALEQFVAREFAAHYGAAVSSFMPWLVGLSSENGLEGVAGLRPAGLEPLFIEQYLDRPIERELSLHAGLPVTRARVMEIGNLAGLQTGVARFLFPLLAELIYHHGYDWAVCNTTPTVQNALRRLGIPFIPLVQANPARLGAGRLVWGRYYEQETTVIAMYGPRVHPVLDADPAVASLLAQALHGQIGHLPRAGQMRRRAGV